MQYFPGLHSSQLGKVFVFFFGNAVSTLNGIAYAQNSVH